VYLDYVTANTNKTDFDRDSTEWTEIQEEMFKILKPHIDDLLGREIKEPTDEEKQRVKDAKELVTEMMKMRKINLNGNFLEGESVGQKQPERTGKTTRALLSVNKNREHFPKTPPPKDAVVKGSA